MPLFDIVIFGATSFVGQILVRHLSSLEESNTISWAIAGRSADKLENLQQELATLNPEKSAPPSLIADAGDEESLQKICQQSRVVVSTVGPYALYGEPLVKACCENGTDYCDLTGEVHWLLKMIATHQQAAAKSGARIVNCCGFDSIPSDLGVYFTQQQSRQRYGRACDEINMRVRKLKGSFSGGTYASFFNAVKEVSETPALQKALASPYALCPSDHVFEARQRRHSGAGFDELTQQWIAPFIMEGINTRIVHRSNALLSDNDALYYGNEFHYDEALVTGERRKGRKKASRTSMALMALTFGASIGPIRSLISQYFFPKPGEGPSQQQQDEGCYELLFAGKVIHKGEIRCTVKGDKDPGYGSTAKILAQAALCLAQDIPKEKVPGGFWTPATIFGDTLIARLQEHAGVEFNVEDADS